MGSTSLSSFTTFLQKTTSSSSLSKERKNSCSTVLCCHGRRTNASPSTVMKRSSMAATEEQVIIKEELGVSDLMNCNGINGSSSDLLSTESGIGITRFIRGKKLFITGATGFLAKVLIEKILRMTPDVGKIYVLIQAKNKKAAVDRLKNEIINRELFRSLQAIHGKNYQAFMLRKLIPVAGNVREDDMGIEAKLAEEISEEIDVVVNSAANTTFDERYDVALDINTIGPLRLMRFAKTFKRLKVFLQVSTAYVNGKRQGRVLEKPFCTGDTIVKELFSHELSADSTMPLLDIEAEIDLAFRKKSSPDDSQLVQQLKDLGLKRAKTYGWQDTYVFTKAMAEMVINSMRGGIPVVTIRPSVIESTWKEPFPGWMEGNRMMDPVVLYYGKGQLNGFLADPNGVLDVVPADMVVNATLAAMAKHGSTNEPGMHIYHIASSMVNPLVFEELARLIHKHFTSFPCMDSKGRPIRVPKMKLFDDMNEFSSHLHGDALQRLSSHEKLRNICSKLVDQAKYLANIYEPYTFYSGRFDNTNTRKLMMEMSEEERREFGFDVGGIDWEDYISNVHIPGLRKHVMKGRGMCVNSSQLVGARV